MISFDNFGPSMFHDLHLVLRKILPLPYSTRFYQVVHRGRNPHLKDWWSWIFIDHARVPKARFFCCRARQICCFCAWWTHWHFQRETILFRFFFLPLFTPYPDFFFVFFLFPLSFPFIFPRFSLKELNYTKRRNLAWNTRAHSNFARHVEICRSVPIGYDQL